MFSVVLGRSEDLGLYQRVCSNVGHAGNTRVVVLVYAWWVRQERPLILPRRRLGMLKRLEWVRDWHLG